MVWMAIRPFHALNMDISYHDYHKLRAETRKTYGFPGSLRSSNGQRSSCSSKLGICFFIHLTLPFADIVPQFCAPWRTWNQKLTQCTSVSTLYHDSRNECVYFRHEIRPLTHRRLSLPQIPLCILKTHYKITLSSINGLGTEIGTRIVQLRKVNGKLKTVSAL